MVWEVWDCGSWCVLGEGESWEGWIGVVVGGVDYGGEGGVGGVEV